MSVRVRTRWSAGAAAGILVLTLAGSAFATALRSDDLDGNGVADTCQTNVVVADQIAAEAAFAAADLNDDGTISVSEAAQTDWTGGQNCNHGGYVSSVASGSSDACDPADTDSADETNADATTPDTSADACDTDAPETQDTPDSTVDTAPADCQAIPFVPAPVDPTAVPAPNDHGKAVSAIAQSDAIGGKNCNHGGAVSEVAKAAHGAAKADHAAAKAERAAAKAATKAAKRQNKVHHTQD